jgi:hypothetical protein
LNPRRIVGSFDAEARDASILRRLNLPRTGAGKRALAFYGDARGSVYAK